MSIASVRARRHAPFRHRRRQLALGALTVLLHLVVFQWFSGQIGRPRREPVTAEAPMLAELIDAAPARPMPAAAALPPPKPKLSLPPLPDLDPEPVAVADPAPPAPPADADGPAGDAGDVAAGQASAAPAAADVQSGPGIAASAGANDSTQAQGQAKALAQAQGQAQVQAQPAPAPEPSPAPRHYKVDVPPSADITLDVARVDANGTRWSGEELLSWRATPSSYRIRIEAGISIVFAHVNLLTLTSEGTLGDDGLAPTLMTEKRRGRALTATHFNRDAGTLTFSASQARYGLVPGEQDKASLPMQLAAIARGDPQQLSGNIDIFVGEDRDASVFSFVVAGQEQVDTPLGRIATWHLVRPPKPGSYNSRLDLWLAPGYDWYPVQIRNLEASGAVTTETARSIVKKDAGNL